MTVEFRLGHGDHKVVEDFLSREPGATSAITLNAKFAHQQRGAAETALDRGVSVFYETGVERLAEFGYGLEKFPLWNGEPFDIDRVASSARERQSLVERTLEAHPDVVTHVTAPQFYVESERSARLNVDLAEATRLSADLPARAVLTVAHGYAKRHAAQLAIDYAFAGVTHIELRLSPFGGEDESLRKVRDGFTIAQSFTDAGLKVTLGLSGNLGQTAVVLGHVESYSVGVGLFEHVNHRSQVTRQKTPPKPRTDDDKGGGPTAGIYLPGLHATAPPKTARALLGHSDIRTRIGCRTGQCGASVQGPLLNAREHYLHARDLAMTELLAQPPGWRATAEVQRLRAALALRVHINRNYVETGDVRIPPLKTRTIASLISDVEAARQAS